MMSALDLGKQRRRPANSNELSFSCKSEACREGGADHGHAQDEFKNNARKGNMRYKQRRNK